MTDFHTQAELKILYNTRPNYAGIAILGLYRKGVKGKDLLEDARFLGIGKYPAYDEYYVDMFNYGYHHPAFILSEGNGDPVYTPVTGYLQKARLHVIGNLTVRGINLRDPLPKEIKQKNYNYYLCEEHPMSLSFITITPKQVAVVEDSMKMFANMIPCKPVYSNISLIAFDIRTLVGSVSAVPTASPKAVATAVNKAFKTRSPKPLPLCTPPASVSASVPTRINFDGMIDQLEKLDYLLRDELRKQIDVHRGGNQDIIYFAFKEQILTNNDLLIVGLDCRSAQDGVIVVSGATLELYVRPLEDIAAVYKAHIANRLQQANQFITCATPDYFHKSSMRMFLYHRRYFIELDEMEYSLYNQQLS